MSVRPVSMLKLRVIGLRKDLPNAVNALHEAGLVEIREMEPGSTPRDALALDYVTISEQLVRLRGIENFMTKCGMGKLEKHLPLEKLLLEAKAIDIDSRLSHLKKEADEDSERKKRLNELRKVLAPLKDARIDFSNMRSERIEYHLGFVNPQKFPRMRKELGAATKNQTILYRYSIDKAICLIAVERGTELGGIFGEAGFFEVDMTGLEGTPAKALLKVETELSLIENRDRERKSEIRKISGENYCKVARLIEMLEIEADRSEVVAKFGRTERLFTFEGFAPERDLSRVKECLSGALGENYVMQTRKAGEEEAPTLLEHGKVTKPIQFLVEFYSLPQVGEIDPTNILFFTFPIIYGMMLGDVGYGVISLLLSLVMLKKFKGGLMAGFAKLWAYASIPAIFFGIFFDEWLGFTHSHLLELLGLGPFFEHAHLELPLYKGMSRIEDVTMLIALSLLAGVLQMFLGFMLGVINNWEHHRGHSYAKMGWLGILIGGFFGICIMFFKAFPADWLYPSGALFGLGALAVLAFEGPMGLFEIPGLIGNILSYARIAGVGLAGVIPAEFIINKMLLPKPEAGLVMFIILIPVFAVVHLMNVLLGMVESLAQGARLNMVEFYSKFYKGGGRKFTPFRVERSYTER